MNAFPHIVSAMGNSLWQSAIVAALAWGALRCVRRSTAALRYAVWWGVLVAALALPVVNAMVPVATVKVVRASDQPVAWNYQVVSAARHSKLPPLHKEAVVWRYQVAAPSPAAAQPAKPDAAQAWAGLIATASGATRWISERASVLAYIWALGAGLLLVRLAAGFVRLRYIKKRLIAFDDSEIRLSLKATKRPVAFGASHDVDCPCVIGYVRPVIALPAALLRDLDRPSLMKVLSHELGHVRRWDDWSNLLQQIARAVLFVNPVVHIACRQLDVDREIACDDLVAAGRSDRIEYAKCLTEIARRTTFAEHLVPAAGFFPDRKQIVVRIEQLLDRNHDGSARIGAVPAVCAIVLAIAVIALAKYQIPEFADVSAIAAAAQAPSATVFQRMKTHVVKAFAVRTSARVASMAAHAVASAAPRVALPSEPAFAPATLQSSPVALARMATELRSVNRAVSAARVRWAAPVTSAVTSARLTALNPIVSAVNPVAPKAPSKDSMSDFLDALSAAGYTHLSVDELIAVRNAGVTADFLRGLKKNGVLPMPIDKLIAVADAGVDAEYIAAMHDTGYGDVSVNDLIAMANAGVTPAFARAAAASIKPRPSLHDLVAMSNAGVSPTYISTMGKLGYANMSVNALVAMANAGVSTSYVAELVKLGYSKMSVDTLVALANAGVSPSYVAALAKIGYTHMSLDTLISLANSGVSASYIKSLADVGYSGMSSDDLIRMANAGVTDKMIKSLRAHGIGDKGNLSIDELIKLANAGF
jgi:beta-lactamase regulating signal transducer with metallopeptidase domain